MAGKCRNRTYQPPCEGLNGFEDRANHQIRTLPFAGKALWHIGLRRTSTSRAGHARRFWSLLGHFAFPEHRCWRPANVALSASHSPSEIEPSIQKGTRSPESSAGIVIVRAAADRGKGSAAMWARMGPIAVTAAHDSAMTCGCRKAMSSSRSLARLRAGYTVVAISRRSSGAHTHRCAWPRCCSRRTTRSG